jgi:hypothetical protein
MDSIRAPVAPKMALAITYLIGRLAQSGTLMLKSRRWNPWIGCLLAVSAGLVGCAPKTDVSATGNVPSQYSHVFMSVQEIWFNTSATAGPDDTTWQKFPLTTPVTIDLATSVDGTLNALTTGLNLPVATYAQARLIPVDASAALLSSASGLGAVYNSEVDYTDTTGVAHQLQLELQNPDKGIGVTANIQVKANTNAALSTVATTTAAATTDTTTTTDGTGGTSTNGLTGTTTTTDTAGTTVTTDTGTGATTTTPTATTATTPTTTAAAFNIAINVDGSKDLVPFTYGSASGVLLNPHVTAFDQATAGAIQGTLDVSNLTDVTGTGTSTDLNIQVTAELLSADGSRYVAVNSAPVSSSGTFTLYPLSTTTTSSTGASTTASYDLVIHGPGMATVIVRGVTVTAGDPTTTTPVNIGTITARATTSFPVTLAATTTPLPAGALVGFYQTLPVSGEVPHLIDAEPIDPFSRIFATGQTVSLPQGSLDYGTYAAGSTVTLTTATATEGASTFRVAGTAPLFTDGVLTTTTSLAAATVAVPTLTAASGAALSSATITISKTSATQLNQGELIISHDGAIVATAPLDTLLAQSGNGNLTIGGIPTGLDTAQFAPALYYVSIRAWNSRNPGGTLVREIYPTPLDLRTGAVSAYSLQY